MRFLTLCLLFVCSLLLSKENAAQLRELNGIVTVGDSIPLLNAPVKVRSTKQIVKTDSLGQFTVQCKAKDKLIVRGKAINTVREKVDEDVDFVEINVELRAPDKPEYVELLSGRYLEADVLNAISSVQNDEADFSMYSDMLDLLQGRFSGVDVYAGRITIRGASSPSGSNNPLIVVDGVETSYESFLNIHPMDVRRIDVLKDASTSMYGFKGGNGVIVVKTRRGMD